MSVPAALAAALATAADFSALAIPDHADVAVFVLALAGLAIGRRLSPRGATRTASDDA